MKRFHDLTDTKTIFLAVFKDDCGIRLRILCLFLDQATDVSKTACMPSTQYEFPISSFVQEVPTYMSN